MALTELIQLAIECEHDELELVDNDQMLEDEYIISLYHETTDDEYYCED